ncbi:hypothetical protein FDP41_001176 [Naegleria fowleri]|uniref:Uncharacterized protein n=1 Tax=Naegleria fowleri TaxID=5763 RepID=A0A6A5BPR5_NAEFO|nr:uncharacterized protein FDP41_001176 [Naegleria fowleri]KAF0980023.1 hypothetical protein FDP41_001176 [Naegleria fowleri]
MSSENSHSRVSSSLGREASSSCDIIISSPRTSSLSITSFEMPPPATPKKGISPHTTNNTTSTRKASSCPWPREITKRILLFLIPIITERIDIDPAVNHHHHQSDLLSATNDPYSSYSPLSPHHPPSPLIPNNNHHHHQFISPSTMMRRSRRPSRLYGKRILALVDCLTIMHEIHNYELVSRDFYFVLRRHFAPIFYADLLFVKYLWMTNEDTHKIVLADIRKFILELRRGDFMDHKPISYHLLLDQDYFHRSLGKETNNATDYKALFSKINHAWFVYRTVEVGKKNSKQPAKLRHSRSQSFSNYNSPLDTGNVNNLISPKTPSSVNMIKQEDLNSKTPEVLSRNSIDSASSQDRTSISSSSNYLGLPTTDNLTIQTPNKNANKPQQSSSTTTPSRSSHRRTYSSNSAFNYEIMYETFRKSEQQIEDEEYLHNDNFSTENQSRAIRVAIMGSKNVGKSMFMMKFSNRNCDEFFEPKNPEDEFICVDTERYTIDMYDTVGQEISESLIDYNIRHFDLFILLFDLTQADQSLEYVQQVIQLILRKKHYIEISQVPIIICGNKMDALEDTSEHISIKERVDKMIKRSFGSSSVPPIYVEISSLEGTNISNKVLERLIAQQYHACHKFSRVANTIDWNNFIRYVFNFGDSLHFNTNTNKEKCMIM